MSGEGKSKVLVLNMETCQEHLVHATFSLPLMVAGFEEWKQKNVFYLNQHRTFTQLSKATGTAFETGGASTVGASVTVHT